MQLSSIPKLAPSLTLNSLECGLHMFNNNTGRKPINIRVASDTILYAPLYTFVQSNSREKSPPFRFHINHVNSSIKLDEEAEEGKDLWALLPIKYDPVFSPVIVKDHFGKNPQDWFGVGDPLRVRRLVQSRKDSSDSFKFVASLINKLAFWIVAESHCKFEKAQNFNYIGCHSVGMTGYLLAESMFLAWNNNPLAPCKIPGREVDLVFRHIKVDRRRRNNTSDPFAWFAAVTSEIDKIRYLTEKHGSTEDWKVKKVHQEFSDIPEDYLLTAIVARSDKEAILNGIKEATHYLTSGIQKEIKRLQSIDEDEQKEFLRDLVDFYWSHGSFRVPWNGKLSFLHRHMFPIIKELKEIYSTYLCAPLAAKEHTDRFLWKAIRSDMRWKGLKQDEIEAKINYYHNLLRTDSWNAPSLWQSTEEYGRAETA